VLTTQRRLGGCLYSLQLCVARGRIGRLCRIGAVGEYLGLGRRYDFFREPLFFLGVCFCLIQQALLCCSDCHKIYSFMPDPKYGEAHLLRRQNGDFSDDLSDLLKSLFGG
jgi:hypothetical protein